MEEKIKGWEKTEKDGRKRKRMGEKRKGWERKVEKVWKREGGVIVDL